MVRLTAFTFMLIVIANQPASAFIWTYDSPATFGSIYNIASTNTFDSLPDQKLGSHAVFDGIFYDIANDPIPSLWINDIGSLAPSPPNVLFVEGSLEGIFSLTFGPGQSVEGVGFYTETQGWPNSWIIHVEAVDGSIYQNTFSLWLDEHRFFGFASPSGIKSVAIRDQPGDDRAISFSIDNVMRTAVVPEPSTLLLAALAGLGLVAMRVRSKR
jgi:hypothetical protein